MNISYIKMCKLSKDRENGENKRERGWWWRGVCCSLGQIHMFYMPLSLWTNSIRQ